MEESDHGEDNIVLDLTPVDSPFYPDFQSLAFSDIDLAINFIEGLLIDPIVHTATAEAKTPSLDDTEKLKMCKEIMSNHMSPRSAYEYL